MRFASLAFCFVLSMQAQAQAQVSFDWSSAVICDLRSNVRGGSAAGGRAVDADRLDACLEGMTLLIDPGDLPKSDLHAVAVDPPPDLLAAEVDWEAAFASVSDTVPPRVIRLRTGGLELERLHRVLLAPAGMLLDAVPEDEVTRQVIAFRLRHPAVGGGRHERLVNNNYTFHRSLERPEGRDDVVVVFGTAGTTTVNVSRVFADDTILRDALTGRTTLVSFGMARFEAHDSGLMLIEEQP